MQVKYSISRNQNSDFRRLIANADQVIRKLLYCIRGHTRLDCFWIMGDQNSLCSLDDDDAFLPLWWSRSASIRPRALASIAIPSCRTDFGLQLLL